MNERMTTVRQGELITALREEPTYGSIPLKEYFKRLEFLQFQFKTEVESNVFTSNSNRESIEYLTSTLILFQNSFMFFEGSFEILLFPNEQLITEKDKITSFNKVHVVIFKMAIETIQNMIEFVKFTQSNNLFPIQKGDLSKYITNNKKCKVIDIVELGFALFHSQHFNCRTGEPMILFDFIEDLGKYFGMEIKNISQRITELHNRIKNPTIFLEKLILTYSINIKI